MDPAPIASIPVTPLIPGYSVPESLPSILLSVLGEARDRQTDLPEPHPELGTPELAKFLGDHTSPGADFGQDLLVTNSHAEPASVPLPERVDLPILDGNPSLLERVYRNPINAHHFSGPFPEERAVSNPQHSVHLMAAKAVAPSHDHSRGRPSNPSTYTVNPASPEAIAAHVARAARAAGDPAPVQHIVQGTHEVFLGHSLDFLA